MRWLRKVKHMSHPRPLMVFDLCKRDSSWFRAAMTNKADILQAKLTKNVNTRDFRKTNIDVDKPNETIIKGFTALHYGCYYGHMDVVKLLLPHEIAVCTEKEVAIPSPGFSAQAKYRLLGGSTCIGIALLRGKGDVVKYIMEYLQQNPDKRTGVVGKLDDDSLCTYLIATICKIPEAYEYMKNPLFIDNEFFLCKTGDMTPVMNAAFFGRPLVAQIITDLAKDEKYKEGIYKMVLSRDNGDTNCLELCKTEVDYVKYGCSFQEKEQCYKILRELCNLAYKYAEGKKSDAEWGIILQTFTKGQTFE